MCNFVYIPLCKILYTNDDDDDDARVVNVWNSLPEHVVDVNSLKQCETRLDKFWRDQDVESSRGWGMGRGYPPPQPTRGSGGAS